MLEVKNIFKQEKLVLFNLGLTLTDFPTTRPRNLKELGQRILSYFGHV